jgi:hypothetical protein
MGLIMSQLSEKRWVLDPIWQKCSTIHFQEREIIGGLTAACPHRFKAEKISKLTNKAFLAFANNNKEFFNFA